MPPLRRLTRRVGRRGAALAAFGLVDVVVGWSLLDPQMRPRGPQAETAYRALVDIAPYPVWGWLWLAVAAVCAAGAVTYRDALAFGCAIGIKLVWAGGFAASWLVFDAYRGWVSAATWGVLAALVVVIAGWPEPALPPPAGSP